MRKTNSKEVKQYFREYLNDVLTDNFNGSIEAMQEQFFASCSISGGKLDRKYSCFQDAFVQMIYDYVTPYTSEAMEILTEALQYTEVEKEKYYDTDKIFNMLSMLFYRAFTERCKKENINPVAHFTY